MEERNAKRWDEGCRLRATPVDIGRGTVGRLVVENRMSGDGQREVGGWLWRRVMRSGGMRDVG